MKKYNEITRHIMKNIDILPIISYEATLKSDVHMKLGDIKLQDIGYYMPHAYGQLLNILAMPVSYINRCQRDIVLPHLSYWINKFSNKNIILRYYSNKVRAVVSSRFNTEMDDIKIIPAILERLRELKDELYIYDFFTNHELTIIKFKLNKTINVPNIEDLIDMKIGMIIINSEVGLSSLKILPVIILQDYTLVGSKGFTSKHSNKKINAISFIEELNKIIENAQLATYNLLEQYQQPIIVNTKQAINEFSQNYEGVLSKVAKNLIMEELNEIELIDKLHLAKTIFKYIGNLPVFQRLNASKAITDYLGIFDNLEKVKEIYRSVELE